MTPGFTTILGKDIYGLGSFVDPNPLPVPADTRRVFEYLASVTPGFTKAKALWNTVPFEGREESICLVPSSQLL